MRKWLWLFEGAIALFYFESGLKAQPTYQREISTVPVTDSAGPVPHPFLGGIDSIVLDASLGKNPYMLALSHDGNILYAACWGSNTVAEIDLLTDSVTYIYTRGTNAARAGGGDRRLALRDLRGKSRDAL